MLPNITKLKFSSFCFALITLRYNRVALYSFFFLLLAIDFEKVVESFFALTSATFPLPPDLHSKPKYSKLSHYKTF